MTSKPWFEIPAYTDTIGAQLKALFQPLNPRRVQTNPNVYGAFLESWDVIAHLTRIFGPLNWDKEVTHTQVMFEEPVKMRGGKDGWSVGYRATVRLTVRTSLGVKVSEDVASHESTLPSRGDAHDMALKSAVSEALKRAAKDLGDQFGLSLYNKGATAGAVGSSIAHPNIFADES